MIFYPAHASITGQQKYSNETGRTEYQKDKSKFAEDQHLQIVTSEFESNIKPSKSEMRSNQTFLLDNQSSLGSLKSFAIGYDPFKSCNTNFKCTDDLSTGWNDKRSLRISTANNTNNTWSSFIGSEIDVKPERQYQFVNHMKLNQWARQSSVVLEGFNQTSKSWYIMLQCPSASVNGPLEWQEFSCGFTIEANTTKVRPILNAGWSSEPKREAASWFDLLYMKNFTPFVTDPNLRSQVVYQGLDDPVSMAFLGTNDFLVIEKKGTVQRIVNGVQLKKPVLDLRVAKDEGLLGITLNKNANISQQDIAKPTYVFLYFTAHKKEHEVPIQGKEDTANYLYRYEFLNNTLVNPKLLLDLPAGYQHNGGPILMGPDKQSVYLSVGDIENETYQVLATKALNNKTGPEPDGTGGILRVTQDGEPVREEVLGKTYPLNLYFAYGIRESFGIDFDPLTGKLWDTENGANWGDEINLIEPGFNGGWNKVQGIWRDHIRNDQFNARDITYNPSDLVNFGGKGKYSPPEFIWKYTVGPTAVKFLTTDKLGKQYENDMLVADVNNGRIYHFKLNQNRTGLLLDGPLIDKIADSDGELDNVVFAGGFGLITDLKIGPDGYLYFVVINEGKIYRVVPRT